MGAVWRNNIELSVSSYRQLTDTLLTDHWQLANNRWTVGLPFGQNLSADKWSAAGRQMADRLFQELFFTITFWTFSLLLDFLVDGSSQTERNFPILLLTVMEAIEVNRDAHGTSKKFSLILWVFFFSNPYSLNHTKIEKHLLLFTTNTNILSQQYKQLKTDSKREFALCCKHHTDRKVLWESLESGGNREITIASQYGWIGLAWNFVDGLPFKFSSNELIIHWSQWN